MEKRSIGQIKARELYDSLGEIDGLINEATQILRRAKPSAEDMKKVEQLKNLARTKIGNSNSRRDILATWDKIVTAFEKMEGVAPAGKARKSV